MVERSLSMREGPGSMPGFSSYVALIMKSKSAALTFGLSTGHPTNMSGWPSGLRRQTQE